MTAPSSLVLGWAKMERLSDERDAWKADYYTRQIGLTCRTRDQAAQLLWDFVNA